MGATSGKLDELQEFINFINDFHPAIKFTYEISKDSLSFLDIRLTITNSALSTSVFYKPTDAHTFLDYTSSHPPSCKDSIPYSQLVRLRRICSDDDDFHAKAKEMMHFFNVRGYPESIINKSLNKINELTRNDVLQPRVHNDTNRIPVVLTYHPTTKKVAKIIRDNFKILSSDETTNTIFANPPLCAYRRDKNLKNQLVRSSINSTGITQGSTTPCNRPRCNTCAYVYSADTITGPSGQATIHDTFSCTSVNLIYAITCHKCDMLYIGETKRRMADRFTEHLRSIKLKQTGLPVASHFATNHSLNDITITGIKLCNGTDTVRKKHEERLIYKLGTLAPAGMNVSFK